MNDEQFKRMKQITLDTLPYISLIYQLAPDKVVFDRAEGVGIVELSIGDNSVKWEIPKDQVEETRIIVERLGFALWKANQ